MTQRFDLERVPEFTPPREQTPESRQMLDAVRVTQRNFQKLEAALLRGILDGGMIPDDLKLLIGDVTGTIGSDGSTTVERIRGKTVAAPGPGQDQQVLRYDDGSGSFAYVSLDSLYLRIAQNLSDLNSAAAARTNLGLGAMAVEADDPSDGQEYVRKSNAWAVATGGGGGGQPPLVTVGSIGYVWVGGFPLEIV